MVKDCGRDRIRNPKSNRCVSRTGRIGKALLLKSSSPDYDNDGFITNEALRRNAERVVKGMRKEGTLNDLWRKAQHIDYNTVPLRWSSTPSRSSTLSATPSTVYATPKSSIASNSSPRYSPSPRMSSRSPSSSRYTPASTETLYDVANPCVNS